MGKTQIHNMASLKKQALLQMAIFTQRCLAVKYENDFAFNLFTPSVHLVVLLRKKMLAMGIFWSRW